ncbi:MAG: sulfite exporter TauE/SafE family protein [Victivallales bacterium]|nr:sulfite exporter TauE/SafE family protein [Victivallales bacterium]
MDPSIYQLGGWGWTVACVCAVVLGMSKCGLTGVGSLAVPLMAMVLPPKASTGVLLPLIIMADVCGACCFHRHVNWRLLLKLFPSAIVGIIIGYFLMKQAWMNDQVIRKVIGVIVAFMAILSIVMKKHPLKIGEKEGKDVRTVVFAAIFGIVAGITTMMANAAGPIMLIYLLLMRLPKDEYIGTAAWYFAILNWLKVPFMVHLGLINPDSLLFNAKLAPLILAGACLGYWGAKKMTEQSFRLWIQIFTILAAIKLLL